MLLKPFNIATSFPCFGATRKAQHGSQDLATERGGGQEEIVARATRARVGIYNITGCEALQVYLRGFYTASKHVT